MNVLLTEATSRQDHLAQQKLDDAGSRLFAGTDPLRGHRLLLQSQSDFLQERLETITLTATNSAAAWKQFEAEASAYMQQIKPAPEHGQLSVVQQILNESTAHVSGHAASCSSHHSKARRPGSHDYPATRKPRTHQGDIPDYGAVTRERHSGDIRTAPRGGNDKTRAFYYAWKKFTKTHKLSNQLTADMFNKLDGQQHDRGWVSNALSKLGLKGELRPLFHWVAENPDIFFAAVERTSGIPIPDSTREALLGKLSQAIQSATNVASQSR